MVCALNPVLSSQTEAARSPLSHTSVYMKKRAFHVVVKGAPRHWPHWAVEVGRFPLVAGSVERSALNILERSLFFVHVRSAFGVGGKNSNSWKRSEIAPHYTGRKFVSSLTIETWGLTAVRWTWGTDNDWGAFSWPWKLFAMRKADCPSPVTVVLQSKIH